MLPSVLDSILSRRSGKGWVCPKCKHGMDYQPVASSSAYFCRNSECQWVELKEPKAREDQDSSYTENGTSSMRLFFFLAMAPVTAIWYGFVFSIMWVWFVVPTFHVAPLRIPFAIGLAYIIQFLTHQTGKSEDDPGLGHSLMMALIKPSVLLFAGWVVTWFI